MKLRQARKIIARGMMLTPQQTPWKDSTLGVAVAVFYRWVGRTWRYAQGRRR